MRNLRQSILAGTQGHHIFDAYSNDIRPRQQNREKERERDDDDDNVSSVLLHVLDNRMVSIGIGHPSSSSSPHRRTRFMSKTTNTQKNSLLALPLVRLRMSETSAAVHHPN